MTGGSKRKETQMKTLKGTDKRALLAAGLAVMLIFTGCGSTKKEASLEDSLGKAIKENEDLFASEDVTEEDTEDQAVPTYSPYGDETDAEDDTDEQGSLSGTEDEDDSEDWFSSHDLEITKQDDFSSFTTALHSKGERDIAGEMKFPASIKIDETTDGCEDGYKKIVIRLEIDPSPSGKYGFTFFSAPLDRYTGTEFREPTGETGLEMTTNKHSVEGHEYLTFSSNGKKVDIEKDCLNEMVGSKHVETTTVICPEDYDGTVFQVGYYDYELEDESDAGGTAERIHRIDETPFFGTNGHKYYYFSYTDD